MIRRFDHMTIVVRDLEQATRFFGLLGFQEEKSVVITGEPFASYMGVPEINARHVTLALAGAALRTEVQLLKYDHPDPTLDPAVRDLSKVGFHHICFSVDDLDAEVARLKANGVKLRNQVMLFNRRKLVFLDGPEGITVELAEWERTA